MNRPDSQRRYREIGHVLAHNGFEWLWSKWGIGQIIGAYQRLQGSGRSEKHSQAERLRLTLEELGTTFIKIGQMLSTRPDLVPEDYIVELSKLQDHAPKVPYEDIVEAIKSEFGGTPEEVFATFETEPRAAASISQVHSATLIDGTPVVVKVRRPGIQVQVEEDLAILGQVIRFVTHNTELDHNWDLEGLVEEFQFSLRCELDFTREGQNADKIAKQFQNDDCLHVPKIFWEYSTSGVLTMEDVQGIKINDFVGLEQAGIDRKVLAEHCAHIALVQVVENGFFHADPHPGNFFVQPNGVICLIDFGMVGKLDDRSRNSLIRMALAITHHNSDRLIDELLELGAAKTAIDRQSLRHDLDQISSRYEDLSLGDISAAKVFQDITNVSLRHGLRLPSNLVMVIRVIAMDEGMGASLDPNFNFFEFAQPYFKKFWKKNHSVKAMARKVRDNAIDQADVALNLPEHVLRTVGMIERGELVVTARLEAHDAMSRSIRLSANRVAVSVLTASLIIGLSVLAVVVQPKGGESSAYFVLKFLLFLVVFLGAWLVYAFWRSERE